MMKKVISILMVLVLGVILSTGVYGKAQASAVKSFSEFKAASETIELQAFPGTSTRATGIVIADGVRLRSYPSSNATILELMYSGESIQVITLGNTWSHVKRILTGTKGYCKTQYIGTI